MACQGAWEADNMRNGIGGGRVPGADIAWWLLVAGDCEDMHVADMQRQGLL